MDIILLDRNSNTIIFCKRELVDKIFSSKDSIIIGTNRDGTLKLNKKCTILLFKEKYWFNEDLIFNIFLLVDIADNDYITIGTVADYAFYTYFPDKILKFM